MSLLIPLAETLGVTVTELLEGRRMEPSEPVSARQAEELVQKAIGYSSREARGGPDRKKWALRYGLCLASALAELAWLVYKMQTDYPTHYPAALMTGLGAFFGGYLCLFAPGRLPGYYDENRINYVADGLFRSHVPGVRFNNRNWPHILTWLRVWALLTMTLSGAVCALAEGILGPGPAAAYLPMASLAGLVAAFYVPGRKYE